MLRRLIRRYQAACQESGFLLRLLFSIAFFALSVTISFYAIGYTNTHASNGVTDLILSNIPVFDVGGLFVYGTLLMVAFIVLLCLVRPKRFPFILDSLALFWVIRSIFTSLTHIGPFATQTPYNLDINLGAVVGRFFIGNDLFFSGHTGAAFLMALIFWESKGLRYIFITWSVFFAIVLLLGHIHYSIDVASAFFITYTIYHIALWLFPKEWRFLRATDAGLTL